MHTERKRILIGRAESLGDDAMGAKALVVILILFILGCLFVSHPDDFEIANTRDVTILFIRIAFILVGVVAALQAVYNLYVGYVKSFVIAESVGPDDKSIEEHIFVLFWTLILIAISSVCFALAFGYLQNIMSF